MTAYRTVSLTWNRDRIIMIEPTLSSHQPPTSHQAGGTETADLSLAAAPQRYKIRRELGRGFSSIVYEAQDTVRERTVALKVLTLGQSLSDERREDMAERFLREARAISALSHPGIVSVYEVGQAGDGRHFIAMELLAGESLRARLDREAPLPAEDAVPIALQVADALEYAHGRGIVHRDVKPDNIYVLTDGRVKLMDFGVAHILSEGTLTQTGTVVGSPAYMSPEQISGLPLSGSSDVFSLGVTLAEMLTGHKPFDAPSIPAVMNRILHRPPQIDGIQPRALRKVVEKALAKSQAARYLSAGAFAEALRRQEMPGVAAPLATDTVVMPGPLPRPRPAAWEKVLPVSDTAQEPPSRAALWTFGVAGLVLLVGAPLALSHLSLSSAPVVNASVRGVPPSRRRVAENAPAAQVAHIPAAWGRQSVKRHAASGLHTGHRAHRVYSVHTAAHAVRPVVLAAAPAPLAIAPRPQAAHWVAAARPGAVRSTAAIRPLAARPAAVVHPFTAHSAAVMPAAPVFVAKAFSPAAARHQARVTAIAANHSATVNAIAATRQARLSAIAARPQAGGRAVPPRRVWTILAQKAPHAPRMPIAAALPAAPRIARAHETRPTIVRVADSRQEQSLPMPAPAVRPAPRFAAPAPRPAVVADSPPRLLRHAPAVYPDSLRTSGIGGTVLMRLAVNAQGTVTEATVIQSSGTDDLDAAALDAVGHWFYEPAYQNGQAVPAQVTTRLDFRP